MTMSTSHEIVNSWEKYYLKGIWHSNYLSRNFMYFFQYSEQQKKHEYFNIYIFVTTQLIVKAAWHS